MQEQEQLYPLFQETFHKHYAPLCQYAFTLIKEIHSCEDIVQETFLRVWEKKRNLIGSNELTFYLYTAVRNNCLTFLGKNKKIILGDLTDQEMTGLPAEPHAEIKVETDYDTLLKKALDNLPPKCREVFVLSRVSQLTYQQIGDTLGISVKTVENQMGKALKILRTYIRQKQVCLLLPVLFFLF
jgi:RNA polymerase sigma-70 factor (family 1)